MRKALKMGDVRSSGHALRLSDEAAIKQNDTTYNVFWRRVRSLMIHITPRGIILGELVWIGMHCVRL